MKDRCLFQAVFCTLLSATTFYLINCNVPSGLISNSCLWHILVTELVLIPTLRLKIIKDDKSSFLGQVYTESNGDKLFKNTAYRAVMV